MHWKAGAGKKVVIIGLWGLWSYRSKNRRCIRCRSHKPLAQKNNKIAAYNLYAASDSEIFKNLNGYFDSLISTLSVEIDWNQCLNLLAHDGTMAHSMEMSIGAFSLVAARRSLAGSTIGYVSFLILTTYFFYWSIVSTCIKAIKYLSKHVNSIKMILLLILCHLRKTAAPK